MPTLEIVRAWKDEDYRDTLTSEQRLGLPRHPSGLIEFQESELDEEASFQRVPVACAMHTCFVTKCSLHSGFPSH
jgi:mersacidin/lichenicidin family type 2 lantibiotic